MSLEVPKPHVYKPWEVPKVRTGTKKTMTEAVKKEKTRTLRMLLEQKNTQLSTVVLGIIVITVMLGIAAAMIVLAGINSNTDFYILGGLFAGGGLIFTVIFIVTHCSPWVRDRRIHAQLDKELEELEGHAEAPTVLSPEQFLRGQS